jgi:A/G-specific adenine glycosylase
LRRFPDIHVLAAAPEEEVLAHWQGLGYYSRARNLQQGVREVVDRYGGKVPETKDEMQRLPGIGAYTAGAILSIAHNKPEPAVDGNVLRVFSRLFRIEDPVENAPVRQKIEQAVRVMMEKVDRRGDFTQAIMELGALVCMPRSPRCGECPWQMSCEGFRLKQQTLLPRKKVVAAPQVVQVYSGILIDEGKVLAVRRPDSGILAGMWQFPSIEVLSDGEDEAELKNQLLAHFTRLGQLIGLLSDWQRVTHVFSHRLWKIRLFRAEANTIGHNDSTNIRWLNRADIKTMIWAGPYQKLAIRLNTELGRLQQ